MALALPPYTYTYLLYPLLTSWMSQPRFHWFTIPCGLSWVTGQKIFEDVEENAPQRNHRAFVPMDYIYICDICEYIYVHKYIYIYICMYVQYVYIYICVYIYMYSMYIYIYVYIYDMYIYICICIYIYI